MSVVYEEQNTDISWYANDFKQGSAANNFDRIIELRKKFCHPLTINRDGTLNKKYFSNRAKETAMNWNDIELLQLYQGIYKFGVDSVEKWIKIQSEFLPQRDFIEVRLKLCQLFGVQDLGKYKGRIFKSEKEINDEFEKNKKESIENGTWNKECNVALKPEIAALNKSDIKKLQQKELAEWKKHIYDNPTYIYRISNNLNNNNNRNKGKNNKKKSAKTSNKNKKKQQSQQKNTIDQMLKKQQKKEDMEQEQDQDQAQEVKSKKKQNKKKNKKKSIKQQLLPLMPEDSEDEEMLCVE